MPQDRFNEPDHLATSFSLWDALQALGIAVLLVAALFVIVGFLLLPVVPA